MIPQFDNVKELFKFLEKYESDTRVLTAKDRFGHNERGLAVSAESMGIRP